MEEKFPKRKSIRFPNFDYSASGAYFVTVCTKTRTNYFWATTNNVGATIGRPQDVLLSPYGKIVEEAILDIPLVYPAVTVEHYVVMPDHFHFILLIHTDGNGRPMVAPTLDRIVKQLKGAISKKIGASLWQKRFFDHIIRNRQDLEEHIKYISENPIKWQADPLLAKE